MDLNKIGKFIATRRKEKNLSQLQLAELLHVTDRAVSKWECGRSMPDSSIMLELCKVLDISVNELLTGEILNMASYDEKAEQNLVEITKRKEQADKMLLTLEVIIGILSVLILLIPCIIAAYVPLEDWKRILIVCSGLIPCLLGVIFAMRIEQVAGYYKCKHCGHKYIPTAKQITFSMHMGRTRYMECPNCHKKSWQKKVVSLDE
jgi:transcriptional regulator with XRE-family HTH domain/DNA-directed RNA polymerase subunit RPC12/RpoP